MLRLTLIIVIVGIVLAVKGCDEYKLGRGASATPEAITLEELQKGIPDNPYRILGEHAPFYPLVIYSESSKTHSLQYAYYPVLTKDELASAFVKGLQKRGGDKSKLTDGDIVGNLTVRVLVKTRRYATKALLQAAIDHDTFPSKDLQGMVTNKVDSLDSDERRMLKESFRNVDVNRVVLFEEGRTPTSPMMGLLMMVGGGAAILLGIVLLRRKGSAA